MGKVSRLFDRNWLDDSFLKLCSAWGTAFPRALPGNGSFLLRPHKISKNITAKSFNFILLSSSKLMTAKWISDHPPVSTSSSYFGSKYPPITRRQERLFPQRTVLHGLFYWVHSLVYLTRSLRILVISLFNVLFWRFNFDGSEVNKGTLSNHYTPNEFSLFLFSRNYLSYVVGQGCTGISLVFRNSTGNLPGYNTVSSFQQGLFAWHF